jgi:hypothetical protein
LADRPFVPAGFAVPLVHFASGFVIKKLTPAYTAIDYTAVMSARAHIRRLLIRDSPDMWPRESLSLEEDRNDLIMHEREFDSRIAFAYTVLSPDESACLGCVYIDPSGVPSFDAEVTLWALTDEMDACLYAVIREWMKDWPFVDPAFPAFEIPMREWRKALDAAAHK